MNHNDRIFVAGHQGMVGSAIVRRLRADGYNRIILRTRRELDLTRQSEVESFFQTERPDFVFLAAAKVGGIHANNSYPAEFIHENLAIQNNVIHQSWKAGARKLLFLGSSCIYPRDCPQPIKESYLLTGPLEPTNEAYAIAKIAGIKMCQAYRRQYGFDAICAMPTNLYGPGDNFSTRNAHVVPALIAKFHDSLKEGSDSVRVWGSGKPLREFLHVDDLAECLMHLMINYSNEEIINVGSGEEVAIAILAEMIAQATGFNGTIEYDRSMPDGTPRKLLDCTKIKQLGWRHKIDLPIGLSTTVQHWVEQQKLD